MSDYQNATAITRTLALRPESVSLKRAAWAYGCAKKGSEEERLLLDLLLRVVADPQKRAAAAIFANLRAGDGEGGPAR